MRSLCLMSLAVLILAAPASAQQGATELRGVVLDAQKSVLPGVSLTIRNQDTGTFRETVSNPDGTYFVTGLVPGVYELRASLAGFRELVRQDVRLEVGRTTTVDVTLEVGRLEEAVTVTAETPLLDVTSKEIGGHITGRELDGAAVGQPQLHRVRRAAAGHRAEHQHRVVRLGRRGRQRHRLAEQQFPGRRRQQQRRRDRAARGHAGQNADRGDSGVPGPDPPVRRRVRPHDGRRDQRHHQAGDEPVHAAARSPSSRTRR